MSSVAPEVLKSYPLAVRSQLPLIVTRKGAMERDLYQLIETLVSNGSCGFKTIADLLKEMQHERLMRQHVAYLEIAVARASKAANSIIPPAQQVPDFRSSAMLVSQS